MIKLLAILTLGWFILGINSYGTSDVQIWVSWAQSFTSTGFWPNYHKLVDYPLFAAGYVNLIGILTKFIFGSVTEANFPGVFKTMLLPFILICVWAINSISRLLTNKNRGLLITLMVFLNPAIMLNMPILGYIDVLFLAIYFVSLLLLCKIEYGSRHSMMVAYLFGVLLTIGFHIKPQWVMFAAVLVVLGGFLIVKNKLYKPAVLGLVTGILIPLLLLSYGAGNIGIVAQRIGWVKYSTVDMVANQKFVVANFPNLWQGINFVMHKENKVTGMFEPLQPWKDRGLAQKGKWVFISVGLIYSAYMFLRLRWEKSSVVLTIIAVSLWLNLIYAFFNTSVHENHLIASVYLSAAMFAIRPSRKNFNLYLIFTVINFFNLFYYYACGMTGLFGRCHKFTPFNMNISLVLLVIYTAYLVKSSYRLFFRKGNALGLTD